MNPRIGNPKSRLLGRFQASRRLGKESHSKRALGLRLQAECCETLRNIAGRPNVCFMVLHRSEPKTQSHRIRPIQSGSPVDGPGPPVFTLRRIHPILSSFLDGSLQHLPAKITSCLTVAGPTVDTSISNESLQGMDCGTSLGCT